jgi:hypothetical protein
MLGYKKSSKQQYALERKKILSKVESKLKKAGKKVAKGKTRTKTTAKTEALVKPLPAGRKATLHFKDGGLSVTAKVRYETEKVDPLIKTVLVADGKKVQKRYIGPAKRVAYFDEEGKEHNAKDIQTMQELDDGRLIPIKVEKTKDIKVDPVPAKVAEEFHPYSFLELWGEDQGDVEGLREVAFQLKTKGQVGAVKKFSHGYGKMYVGFLRPVISSNGKHFGLELMLSENKKQRRRWMPTELGEAEAKKKPKAEEPVVPELW